jgi:hypothetical protein
MWEPPAKLLDDANFIMDMPHGCDACFTVHQMYTDDWICNCEYCVRSDKNAYEKSMRKMFDEWSTVYQSQVCAPSGRIGVLTDPCPVDVSLAREFGLYFEKDGCEVVRRDWSGYDCVKAIGPGIRTFEWQNVIERNEKFVLLKRVEMPLPPADSGIIYFLIKSNT